MATAPPHVLFPWSSDGAPPASAVAQYHTLSRIAPTRALCGTRACAASLAVDAREDVRMLRLPSLTRGTPLERIFSRPSLLVLKLRLLARFEAAIEHGVALAALHHAVDASASSSSATHAPV